MGAVHVGVGHDDDLVVAQLVQVEVIAADAGAQGGDQRADFVGRQHAVETGALHVQDLAAQGQDGLEGPVAALLGRAAGRIALDDEQLRLGRVALLAVGQLAGQGGHVQRPLAPGQLARLAGGLARDGGVDDLLDDVARLARMLLEPLAQPVAHQALDRRAHLRGHQLVLGLAGEFRVGNLHRQHRRQPFARVVAGQRHLGFLGDAAFVGVAVDGAGQGRAEGGQMGAAVALGDVVGEAEDVLVVAVVPLQRQFHADAVALAGDGDGIAHDRILVAIQVVDEGRDAALVEQLHLTRLHMAPVAQPDAHAGIEERQLAEAVLQPVEIELHVGEGAQRRLEGDLRAGLVAGRAGLGQVGLGLAMLEAHAVFAARPPDHQLQPFRQGVDHRHAHPVQAAGDLVAVLVELPAGVQLGHDHLGGRHAFLLVDVGGDAAAVVEHGHRAVRVQGHLDDVAEAGQRLVDGVVGDLEHHVVQARAVLGVADIHARTLAHRIQALQDLDRAGAIILGTVLRRGQLVIGHRFTSFLRGSRWRRPR